MNMRELVNKTRVRYIFMQFVDREYEFAHSSCIVLILLKLEMTTST